MIQDCHTLLVVHLSSHSAIALTASLINLTAEYYLNEKTNLFTLLTIMCSSLLCISLWLSTSLHLFPVQVTPMLSPADHISHSFCLTLHFPCVCVCVFGGGGVLMVKSTTKMSLPVNSDYLSLEKIARYRHACSNGSPYATNKPIDIKPRGRRW